jgi:hypothetical protein
MTGGRIYFLMADSEASRSTWIEALNYSKHYHASNGINVSGMYDELLDHLASSQSVASTQSHLRPSRFFY